jgi:hypothetical protein
MRGGRALTLGALAMVCLSSFHPALADDACAALGGPVDHDRAMFADPNLLQRPSGERLMRIGQAVELALKPNSEVGYFLPPTKAPRRGTFGGLVTFSGVPRPGSYRVTLSDVADIDVFENGARIRSTAAALAPNCPDVQASALFRLAPGDLVLVQISSAPHSKIKVAFAEAP